MHANLRTLTPTEHSQPDPGKISGFQLCTHMAAGACSVQVLRDDGLYQVFVCTHDTVISGVASGTKLGT